MLNVERQAKIFELIEEHGKVEVDDLGRSLNASEVTIRKDLKELQGRWLLRRAHGGSGIPDELLHRAVEAVREISAAVIKTCSLL